VKPTRIFAATLLALTAVVTSASAGGVRMGFDSTPAQVKLHLVRALSADDSLSTDGAYLFAAVDTQSVNAHLTLVNAHGASRRIGLPVKGCRPGATAVGGGFLALNCRGDAQNVNTYHVYSLSTRHWRTVRLAGKIAEDCRHAQFCGVKGVGSRWLQISVVLPPKGASSLLHGYAADQSLTSPRLARFPPQTPGTVSDLDAATPAHQVCKPVKVPAGSPNVAQYGRVVFYQQLSALGLVEQMCGSSHMKRLGALEPFSPDTWISPAGAAFIARSDTSVDGVTLGASDRRFTAKLPYRGVDVTTIAIAGRDVFVYYLGAALMYEGKLP
jgi:hypothetical protein